MIIRELEISRNSLAAKYKLSRNEINDLLNDDTIEDWTRQKLRDW